MADEQKIIEKILSDIDWYVIEKVRELRASKFSQAELSREIGFSDGFIGRVENPQTTTVYNLRHINLIAKALKIKTTDILPAFPLEGDLIMVKIQLGQRTKKVMGEANYSVLSKTVLSEKEIEDYNKTVLHRKPKSKKKDRKQK